MTLEEHIFKTALEGDEDLARELLADLDPSALSGLADTLELLDELVMERL